MLIYFTRLFVASFFTSTLVTGGLSIWAFARYNPWYWDGRFPEGPGLAPILGNIVEHGLVAAIVLAVITGPTHLITDQHHMRRIVRILLAGLVVWLAWIPVPLPDDWEIVPVSHDHVSYLTRRWYGWRLYIPEFMAYIAVSIGPFLAVGLFEIGRSRAALRIPS